jgi:hypothetical protein
MALALSQEQISLLLDAAAAVPMNWKGRFMSAVADQLTLIPNPTNRDVIRVVSECRRAFALGTTDNPPSGHACSPRAPYRRRIASGA